MTWYEACLLMLGTVVGMMAIGVPVAISFLVADIIGVWIFMGGGRGIVQLVNNAFDTVTSFSLVPLPLFVLMGELFFHSGLGQRVLGALDNLLGRIPGRLSYLAIGSGTLFATLSGSSMANTALMGTLMVPEMERRGYSKTLSMGPILASGGLAMIIPPSGLAILLGSLARIDIGALLIAGVVPGLVLAVLYFIVIYLLVRFNPKSAPRYDIDLVSNRTKIVSILRDVLPMGIVIFSVIGLIVFGWATPSEAAAFGAFSVILLAILFRKLSFEVISKSVLGTLRVTAMIFLIILASSTFSQVLAFSGGSSGLIGWATNLGADPYVLLLTMFCIYLALGCFMDQLSIMMLTVPIFFPLATIIGYDPIWFGIIVLISLEISNTTPPFGLLLFVMKGVAPPDTTMQQIFVAAAPFMGCAILLVFLLVLFPEIVLWLPHQTR